MVNYWSIENKLYPNVLPSEVVHVSQSTVKNHFIVIDMNCELIIESVNRDIPISQSWRECEEWFFRYHYKFVLR